MRQRLRPSRLVISCSLLALVLAAPAGSLTAAFVARDPGPRVDATGVGGPLPGLGTAAMEYFLAGQAAIQRVASVQGTIDGTRSGLGPRFNLDSCAGCHGYPTPGGSSPPLNPQVALATSHGAQNTVPFFITIDGPIRDPLFKGTLGGGMEHGSLKLYTITGRVDAPGCSIAQPDFDALASAGQLTFHSPSPLYGLGLIEAIDDAAISANLGNDSAQKQALGIAGHVGLVGTRVGRFNSKAQGFDLFLSAAGAMAGDMGVTTALIRKENDQTAGCTFNALPEDTGDPNPATAIGRLPDYVKVAYFVRYLAAPTPARATVSTLLGRQLFVQVGCALCHTPSLQTGSSLIAALKNKTVNLYSDLALHRMGPGLADGVAVGNAGPDEFRTTPLWGLGHRIFLLHDGRTTDLLEAIRAHASPGDGTYAPSEANAVIAQFNALTQLQQQYILSFLRSL